MNSFIENIRRHVALAKEKHPTFAKEIGITRENAFSNASDFQKKNEEEETITNILLEEVYEFLYEIACGNIERATEEAADVVAVLFRTVEWLEEQKEIGEQQ